MMQPNETETPAEGIMDGVEGLRQVQERWERINQLSADLKKLREEEPFAAQFEREFRRGRR